MDLGVEVAGGEIEGDGAVVEDGEAVGKLHLACLQIEQLVRQRLGAGAGAPGDRLVGVAVGIDDEMKVRLVYMQIREADPRLRTHAADMREKSVEAQANVDLLDVYKRQALRPS